MKKLIAVVAMLAVSTVAFAAAKIETAKTVKVGAKVEAVKPGITATIALAEDGDMLWCHVKFSGVGKNETIKPVIKWTAPEVNYITKKGKKVALFKSSVYPSPAVRTKTKATRTLVTTVVGTDKEFRATGVWKVEAIVGDVSLAEATYEVK